MKVFAIKDRVIGATGLKTLGKEMEVRKTVRE